VSAPAADYWTFSDNLFDRVKITQWGASVTGDYNGYYLLPAQDRLDAAYPQAAHDKFLANAPPYQTAVLGRYYLQPTGDLLDGGSRGPGDAGLAHHTTRTSQLQEWEEPQDPGHEHVNIGFHYVAVASGQPKDKDGDGLPDFYEDENGNGLADDALGDWTLPDTDTNGVSDGAEDFDADGVANQSEYALGSNPLNGLNDSDLDGNSNLLEKWLETNPTLRDNPIQIAGVAPGTVLSGAVNLQVQVDSSFDVQSLSLVHLGKRLPYSRSVFPPFSSPVTIPVDTTRLPNGTYELRPAGLLHRTSSSNADTLLETALGAPLTVQIFNEINFTEVRWWDGSLAQNEWRDSYGENAMVIDAVSSHVEIDYEIEMLNDANQVVFAFPLDSTTAGRFSKEWDLRNESGVKQESDYFRARITTYWPNKTDYQGGAPGSGTAEVNSPPAFKLDLYAWPYRGGWTIARQDVTKNHAGTLATTEGAHDGKAMLESAIDAFYSLRLTEYLEDTGHLPPPLPLQPYPGWAHKLNYDTDIFTMLGDWGTLYAALRDEPDRRARNFYYFGHGDGDIIGGSRPLQGNPNLQTHGRTGGGRREQAASPFAGG